MVSGDFNAVQESVPVMTIRGEVEQSENGELANRSFFSCESRMPESLGYLLLYQGKGEMIDHSRVSQKLIEFYNRAEIHIEMLHDESIAFASDRKYPESDHAPIVAEFHLK